MKEWIFSFNFYYFRSHFISYLSCSGSAHYCCFCEIRIFNVHASLAFYLKKTVSFSHCSLNSFSGSRTCWMQA
jgi:hypothetical protein